MKKLFTLLICTAILIVVSCDNEPLEGEFGIGGMTCELALANTAQAGLNFLGVNDDNYIQLCTAYRNALQAQILACGDTDGSLQIAVDALGDCSVTVEDDCDSVTNAVDDAQFLFDNANAENYTSLCNAYKIALQNQIVQCGDEDGSIQAIIDNLGDCIDDNQQATDIEGNWLLTAWIGTEAIDLNNDGTESLNFLEEMDCYENETIVFNADATGVIMSTSFATFNFNIVIGTTDEFTYTIDCEFEDENTNMTWSQSGDTVSIDDGTGALEFTLTGNQLSILVPEGFVAFNEDFTATTTQDLTFVYTKQ